MITLEELHGVTRNCISSVGLDSRCDARRQSGHCHLNSLCVLARSSTICLGLGYFYLSMAQSQVWSFCDSRVVAALNCWLICVVFVMYV